MKKYFYVGITMIFCSLMIQNCSIGSSTSTTSATSSSTSTSTTCTNLPAHNATLIASLASSVSHNAGMDCMSSSCHGGTAQTTWAAAGTMATSQYATTWASAGSTITGVSSTNYTLTVDTCGNFYATSAYIGTLKIGGINPTTTASFMRATSFASDTDGSCNRFNCHDNSSRSYIY